VNYYVSFQNKLQKQYYSYTIIWGKNPEFIVRRKYLKQVYLELRKCQTSFRETQGTFVFKVKLEIIQK
jgi:hypothetical protein